MLQLTQNLVCVYDMYRSRNDDNYRPIGCTIWKKDVQKGAQVNMALFHLWSRYTLLSDVASIHKVVGWWSEGCRAKWPPIDWLIRRHAEMVLGDIKSCSKRTQRERSGDRDSQGSVSQARRRSMEIRTVCGRALSFWKISSRCYDRNGNRTGLKIKSTLRCVVRVFRRVTREVRLS